MGLQQEQSQLMAKIGVNQAKIAQYSAQLGPMMQEMIFDSSITLEDVKKNLNMKTEYLQIHG